LWGHRIVEEAEAMPSDKAVPSSSSQSHRHIDDPDRTFKGAHKLQPSDFSDGTYITDDSFNYPEDVDVWRFHLNAGDTLTIETDTEDPGFPDFPDTMVFLFDHRGQLITSNDDDPRELTFESYLEYNATSSGNYFVAVAQYYSEWAGGDFAHGGPNFVSSVFGPGGDYTLNLTIA
jgi:Bacterial pre-peptidase C-terminal domain